ncbi:uncharacterized protein [Palaemon carinicauda]|uniref:uncharacterized protein isoform X2 n=1 Tax=Palaemon carinicauda TaxID=392227 RepID=UPI0035B617AB
MINLLLTCGAVPLGYTSELDSEYDWSSSELCSVMETNYQNLRGGHQPLPDVILSNTPPSSPLRRAHSYHFLFPEKSDDQPYPSRVALQRAVSFLPTPPPTPTSPQEGTRGNQSEDIQRSRAEDPDVDSARTGLGHIQEIRRRLGGNPAHFQPHQSLPQLTWEVPRIQRSRRMTSSQVEGEGNGQRGDGDQESPEAREERLRQIGADLRRIADQFQLDNGRGHLEKR